MDVFSVKPKNQPTVVRKKLGKEQAHGKYTALHNLIEIDERLKGRKEMTIYIHEYFHKLFPDMEEEEVILKSEYLTDFMWAHNFRKVDL